MASASRNTFLNASGLRPFLATRVLHVLVGFAATCLWQTAPAASNWNKFTSLQPVEVRQAPTMQRSAVHSGLVPSNANPEASRPTPYLGTIPVIMQLLLEDGISNVPVAVNWFAPTTMGDGSAITGLVGYKIYGSQIRQDLNPPLLRTITDPSSVGVTLSGLASGTWYFSITAYTQNAESDPVYQTPVSLP